MDGLDLPLDRINFTSFNTTLILKDLRAPADIAVYTCISTVGGVQRILSYGVTVVGVCVCVCVCVSVCVNSYVCSLSQTLPQLRGSVTLRW